MPASNPLYPPLPHFFSGYTLSIVYESDPEVIRDLMPEPLEPDPRNLVVINVQDLRWSSCGPVSEGGVWILAKYKGLRGAYMPFMYMDSDVALAAGREIFGYPKKFAKISLTFGGRTLGSGERINDVGGAMEILTGVVNRGGTNIYKINAVLTEKAKTDALIPNFSLGEGSIFLKIIPDVDGKPLVQQLTFLPSATLDKKVYETWRGPATISFEESPSDPIYKLKPIKILGGAYQRVEFWIRAGKVLYKYT
jgi:acetoacetate decarboxylase